MDKYGIMIETRSQDGFKENLVYTFDTQQLREQFISDKYQTLLTCNPVVLTIIVPTVDKSGSIECSCIGEKCRLKGIDINKIKFKHIHYKKNII